MITHMRPLLASLFVLFALALPLAALAADTPSPAAVAACQAEYAQIGADAFQAKYGATEPFGHCYQEHAPTVTTTTTTTTSGDDPATAACRAEYIRLGPDAFKAKYGATEAFGACVKVQSDSHTTTTSTPDKPTPSTSNGDGGAASVASAFCNAEAKALGKVVFIAKYGPKEAMGNCVRAALAKAKSLVASCKASSGSSKDAFKACIAAGVQPRRR
jgi:hypothetical protein